MVVLFEELYRSELQHKIQVHLLGEDADDSKPRIIDIH